MKGTLFWILILLPLATLAQRNKYHIYSEDQNFIFNSDTVELVANPRGNYPGNFFYSKTLIENQIADYNGNFLFYTNGIEYVDSNKNTFLGDTQNQLRGGLICIFLEKIVMPCLLFSKSIINLIPF